MVGVGGAKLLVELSTSGQLEQRRWARSPTGGFERLPPARLDADAILDDAGSSPDEEPPLPWLSFDSWDPRQSPRLRAIFLPAGYPDTVSADYAEFVRWHLLSLVFRNILEVLSAQSLLTALGLVGRCRLTPGFRS